MARGGGGGGAETRAGGGGGAEMRTPEGGGAGDGSETRAGGGGGAEMRAPEGDGGLVLAYYLIDVRHTTRAVEIVRKLLAMGDVVHVVTVAPDFGDVASSRLHIRQVEQVVLDCVAVEPAALTVGRSSSFEAVVPRASILKREEKWLKYIKADLVMLNPWRVGQSDAEGIHGSASHGVVRSRERSSLTPPSKRRRGRSLPPATPPADDSARKRSTSSPPSPYRRRVFGPIVFWDIENCTIQKNRTVEEVVNSIRDALSMNAAEGPAVIKAFVYRSTFKKEIKKALEGCGVILVDVLNKKKEAADKVLLLEMLLFVRDHSAPSSILLISGDGDFAPAVYEMVQRGFSVIVAIPSRGSSSPTFASAGCYMWDWSALAEGKGIVIARPVLDLEAVKARMIRLLQSHNGQIELKDVLPLYQKQFGEPLRPADYNVPKLVSLFNKMGAPFITEKKLVFLQMPTPITLEENKIGADHLSSDTPQDCQFPVGDLSATRKDPYCPMEDQAVEEMIARAPITLEENKIGADHLSSDTPQDCQFPVGDLSATRKDLYCPMEDQAVEEMIARVSNLNEQPNEPLIGKNLNEEFEKSL